MTIKPEKVTDITLSLGEFYFGGGYLRIHTLLGSCIAITLWHPVKRIGGMCHYLLPERGGNIRFPQGHYADDAMSLFLDAINKENTKPQEYEVKLFGGGNMFSNFSKHPGNINVSEANIYAAERLLYDAGFTITSKDVGGVYHRKIYMELWNGYVWVNRKGLIDGKQENYA